MKKRGRTSPDNADAPALTYAQPVGKTDQPWKYSTRGGHASDYDPLAYGRLFR